MFGYHFDYPEKFPFVSLSVIGIMQTGKPQGCRFTFCKHFDL